MGRKVYKIIEKEGSKITIWGANRKIQLQYGIPEWVKKKGVKKEDLHNLQEEYFRYENRRHWLSEFQVTPKGSFLEEFDGYMNDSFFSGVCIKLVTVDHEQYVKAFTFCS